MLEAQIKFARRIRISHITKALWVCLVVIVLLVAEPRTSARAQTSQPNSQTTTSSDWACPVSPASGRVGGLMAPYGDYRPYHLDGGGWHKGIDIQVTLNGTRVEGDNIIATEAGEASVSRSATKIAGWHVSLYANSGNVYYYAHLLEKSLKEKARTQNIDNTDGERKYDRVTGIAKGEIIGKLGASGSAKRYERDKKTGEVVEIPLYHLHFDYKLNSRYNYVDPLPYVKEYSTWI